MDRNFECVIIPAVRRKSPPARVAWIETLLNLIIFTCLLVATREGGVDRNSLNRPIGDFAVVATREGGVDRNLSLLFQAHWCPCRHPRGWRG